MAQKAMVIDLHNCVGCGACGIACKTENNTPFSTERTTFNWADYYTSTEGVFPEVKYNNFPVLCNHCSDAPCVEACPVEDKAIFKTADGVTMTNNERCIGCQSCVKACPYSSIDFKEDGVKYSILSYNMPQNSPQGYWNSTTPFINGSSNPKEVASLAQYKPPYGNEYTHDDYKSVRKSGVVEKCIFCEHRTKVGKQPYCVEVCPSKARIFGDKDDPESSVSKLLAKYKSQSFQNNKGEFLPENEKGTSPNVYYINREKREEAITGIVEETKKEKLFTVYPNPANGYMNIEVVLQNDDTVSIMLYDISGKFAKQLLTNEYVPKGIHTYTREVYNLKPGLYICKVQLSNTFQSQRVVIY